MNFIIENARWLLATALLYFSSCFGQTFFISLFAGEIRQAFHFELRKDTLIISGKPDFDNVWIWVFARTDFDQGEVDYFSGIADTPVEHSTRLREANDSWSAIKRRLKGAGFSCAWRPTVERPKQEVAGHGLRPLVLAPYQ